MSLLLAVSGAWAAGYGVPVDGLPSAEERWLVLWTNAARVAPLEFTDDYAAGGCSTDDFSDDEKTAKPPLYVDIALTDAARYHSADMEENGCFQHESCDGTDTWARIGRFYTDAAGAMGENIAMGSSDGRFAVLSMWMCSHSGHRANIMSGDFNEMGGGISGSYQTQDFAGGELTEGDPPVRMVADQDGAWYADWGDAAAPAELALVRDGVATEMTLAHGEPEQGVYLAQADDSVDTPCHHTYVWWKTAAGEEGTFPAEGSFVDGECDDIADELARWSETQPVRDGLFGDVDDGSVAGAMLEDLVLVGCASAPGRASGWLVVAAGLALGLRRRR